MTDSTPRCRPSSNLCFDEMMHFGETHPCSGLAPAYRLYWDSFVNHREEGRNSFNVGNVHFTFFFFIVYFSKLKKFKYLLTYDFICFYILINHQSIWITFDIYK